MATDRSRPIDRPRFGYTGVVAQQGRVTLDRDVNAAASLAADRVAFDALSFVGPCGTPDDGYRISTMPALFEFGRNEPAIRFPSPPVGGETFNVRIAAGSMYLGGQLVTLTTPCSYLDQPDWPAPDSISRSQFELIWLDVVETEVGAAEDADLIDVALGGPDTTARTKLLQRIRRHGFAAADNVTECGSAWKAVTALWTEQGLKFDPATMALTPDATLQISFTNTGGSTNPCDPVASGGYLGPENQLLRLRVTMIAGAPYLVWGYDNASALYRVKSSSDGRSVVLANDPPDVFQYPMQGQWIEVLNAAAVYGANHAGTTGALHYAAEPAGVMHRLSAAYGPAPGDDATNVLMLDSADPQLVGYAGDPLKPMFVRVWQSAQPIAGGGGSVQIALTDVAQTIKTGVVATLAWGTTGAPPEGACWEIALRPSTPQAIYPAEYLAAPQPAIGPRRWACPLAVIDWTVPWQAKVADCRNAFETLTALTRRRAGCCSFSIEASQVGGGARLQAAIDRARDMAQVLGGASWTGQFTVCLGAGKYALHAPLRFDAGHSGMTLEGCAGRTVLQADDGANPAAFADGLMVMTGATGVNLRALELQPVEAPLPPALITELGQLVSQSGLNVAALGTPRMAFGLRVVNCASLAIVGCHFEFSGARPDAAADLVAAAIFLQGANGDLVVTGCTFGGSGLTPSFTALKLADAATSPGFTHIMNGLEAATLGDRAGFLAGVGLGAEKFVPRQTLATEHAEAVVPTTGLATERMATERMVTDRTASIPAEQVGTAAASGTIRAAITADHAAQVAGNATTGMRTVPPQDAQVVAGAPPAAPAAAAAAPAATAQASLSSADIRDQQSIAAWSAIIGRHMGGAPSAPIIATVGLLAADLGSTALNIAELPCALGDARIGDNLFNEVGFAVLVMASFDSLRLQDNRCLDGIAGLWVSLTGAVTPQVPVPALAYYPKSGYFEEYQYLKALTTVIPTPVDPSPPRIVPMIYFRPIPTNPQNALFVTGNDIRTRWQAGDTIGVAAATSAQSGAGLLLALCRANSFAVADTNSLDSSVVVVGNRVRTGSGIEAPAALVTLLPEALMAMSGNVFANAINDDTTQRTIRPPALSIEMSVNSDLGVPGVAVAGNALGGSSNLSHLRPHNGAPLTSLSPLNADPSPL